MNAIVRPRAAATPARTAAPLPRFSGSTTTWSAPASRATSAVPSVDPSSTTTISSPPSAATSDSAARTAVHRLRRCRSASSRAGITTVARTRSRGGATRHPLVQALPNRLQEHDPIQHEADDRRGQQRDDLRGDQGRGRVEAPRREHRPQHHHVDQRRHRGDRDERPGIRTHLTKGSERKV